jgi:phosphoglucosamine mutase
MGKKLFGTDGIRGVANRYPITPEMALKLGRAAVSIFRNQDNDVNNMCKIVIGKDTRLSGDMLELAIAAGICSMGGEVYLAGVIPTPGVAFLTSSINADAGIVISASHNPYYDNGIKFFNKKGFKLSDDMEAAIESEIKKAVFDDTANAFEQENVIQPGRVHNIENPISKYAAFLKNTIKGRNPFRSIKLVIDCSNGAASQVAPKVFKGLGADPEIIFAEPDGKNINDNCGSQHTGTLCEVVMETKADLGLAFDGDGDRLIAVDEKGKELTGDQILAICAWDMKQRGLLKNDLLVSTVMSNFGLGIALKKMGIKHITSLVGDRYVMEDMLSSGAVIGGEDSGHMIFLDYHTTGDGMLSALRLMEAMLNNSKPLSELASVMDVFPQVLLGVKVKEKPDINTIPEIVGIIKSVESDLGEQGRVLVRYSGTQPLCRIMVEGPTMEDTERDCRKIADVVRRVIGV